MPSVNWILVLTLALLHYLAANPLRESPITAKWVQDMDQLTDVMKNLNSTNCKEKDSTFYSPSNVENSCIVSALNCAIKELKTVEFECSDNNATYVRYVRKARKLIHSTLTNSLITSTEQPTDCKQCEEYELKSYKDFLITLSKLIQQLNSIY